MTQEIQYFHHYHKYFANSTNYLHYFLLTVLEITLRALCVLGRHCTHELYL